MSASTAIGVANDIDAAAARRYSGHENFQSFSGNLWIHGDRVHHPRIDDNVGTLRIEARKHIVASAPIDYDSGSSGRFAERAQVRLEGGAQIE